MGQQRFIKLFRIILTVYMLIGVLLYFLQDAILFHPVTLNRSHRFNFPLQHTDIRIPVNEKDTISVVHFSTSLDTARGVVLYFHGNKRNISWYAKYIPHFTKHGYEVIMIDYPGYGKSTGKLTEKKLYDWALQVYKMAIKKFSAEQIIIYGKSMGTGIATQLASIRDCKRLILETPYYDFPSVIKAYLPIYPVSWMIHYQIPTWQYMPNVTAPITILHGTSDWIVRYKNTKRLSTFLKPGDEVVTVNGASHNNLYSYPLVTAKLDSLFLLP
jgi:alpha-beta hydrolase superfamily lysophospholipase